MPRIIESYEEFLIRHGGQLTQVGPGLWLLPDGAAVADSGMGPTTYEPSPHKRLLLEAKLKYHSTRMANFQDAFNRLKACLVGTPCRGDEQGFVWKTYQDKIGPCPLDEHGKPRDGVRTLFHLQQRYEHHRDAVEAVAAQLEDLPEIKAQRQREKMMEQAKVREEIRAGEERNRIQAVNL